MREPFIKAVVILDREADVIADAIRKVRSELHIIEGLPRNDLAMPYALITFDPPGQVNDWPRPRWVHCAGAGLDKLQAALTFTPEHLTRTVGEMGSQIGEYVLGWILHDAQNMAAALAANETAQWQRSALEPSHIRGRRAVIFGTGEMGQGIARALSGLGVVCDGVSRRGAASPGFERVVAVTDLASLDLSAFDYVICALPNTKETADIFDRDLFGRLSDAMFINIGRGESVDETGLLAAVQAGFVRTAVLDVFKSEPLPDSSPLWAAPRITITPHIAGLTKPQDTADAFLSSLDALEAGQVPTLACRF